MSILTGVRSHSATVTSVPTSSHCIESSSLSADTGMAMDMTNLLVKDYYYSMTL